MIRPAGTQQIWAAAIDPAKLGTGADPSYPAFRVPFQGLDENNHRAFWTLDVGAGGSGGSGGGGGGGGSMGCGSILSLGAASDPLSDCCEIGTYCDTLDSVNHTCLSVVPN